MSKTTKSPAEDKLDRSEAASADTTAKSNSQMQNMWTTVKTFCKNADFVDIFARLFIIVMVAIFPLSGIEHYYQNIVENRANFFFKAVIIAAGVIVIAAIVQFILKKSYKAWLGKDFKKQLSARVDVYTESLSVTNVAVVLFLEFVLLSALTSQDKTLSLVGIPARNNGFLIQLCYVVTYFLILRSLRLHKLDLSIYCFGATLTALLLQIHFFGLARLGTEYTASASYVGPMGNIDFTSYFLSVALVLAAAIYVTKQQAFFDKKGFVILGCFFLLVWSELLIDVDSGVVAMGVAFLVSLPLLLTSAERVTRYLAMLAVGIGAGVWKNLIVDVCVRHEAMGKKSLLMIAAELILISVLVAIHMGKIKFAPSAKTLLKITLSIDAAVILAVLAAAFIAAKYQSSGVLYEFGQMLFYHNFDDKFGSGRIIIWKCSLKLVPQYWLFGVGPDCFIPVFMENFYEDIAPYYGDTVIAEVHNEYLHLLITSGIFALGAFLTFLGSMIAKCCKRAKEEPILACCVIAVIAYAAHAFFVLALSVHTPLMWVMLGLTGAAIRQSDNKKRTENSKTEDSEVKDGKAEDGQAEDSEVQDGETQDKKAEGSETEDGKAEDGEAEDSKSKDSNDKNSNTKNSNAKNSNTKNSNAKNGNTKNNTAKNGNTKTNSTKKGNAKTNKAKSRKK